MTPGTRQLLESALASMVESLERAEQRVIENREHLERAVASRDELRIDIASIESDLHSDLEKRAA